MSGDVRDEAWQAGERVAVFLREMYRFEKAHNYGQPNALDLAVELCGLYDQPLPLWLRRAVLTRLRQTPTKDRRKAFERDVTRWDVVCELRDRRDELKDAYATKWTEKAVFKSVAEMLRETNSPAKGTPDAIEWSYKQVQKLVKKGRGPVF